MATENPNKLKEFQESLKTATFISLRDISWKAPLPPEDGLTYRENALIKARFIFEQTGMPTLSDDSGFEVEALNSEPGVFSGRYLNGADSKLQCADILKRLEGLTNRRSRFVCCLCFIRDAKQEPQFFEGFVEGDVPLERRGEKGFGYDPIFVADGMAKSFAELEPREKIKISHRGRALAALDEYLRQF